MKMTQTIRTMLALALCASPAIAEETKDANQSTTTTTSSNAKATVNGTTVEIRDGKIFVNGVETGSAPAGNSSVSVSSSGSSSVGGSGTITIDVNGVKQTKTFSFGDAGKDGKDGKGKDGGPADQKPVTWLGVSTSEVSEAMRAQLPIEPGRGLVVDHVAPDSPAAKGGIEEHDVLLQLNDLPLMNSGQLQQLIKARKAGDQVTLKYLRKGQEATAEVTLGEHVPTREESGVAGNGLKIEDLLQMTKQPKNARTRDLLKNMVGKGASVVTDSKIIVVGPDGKTTTIDGADMTKKMREMLEKQSLPVDAAKQIQEAMERAQKEIEAAAKKVEDAVKNIDGSTK
jgi:hypothetical protein